MKEIEAKCPSCGCDGEVMRHIRLYKYMVSCKANNSDNHGEDITDWCPDECQTDWYDFESMAIGAWNKGMLVKDPDTTAHGNSK